MGNTASAQVLWRKNKKKGRRKNSKGKRGKGNNKGKIES
jgi:hypothetical protein